MDLNDFMCMGNQYLQKRIILYPDVFDNALFLTESLLTVSIVYRCTSHILTFITICAGLNECMLHVFTECTVYFSLSVSRKYLIFVSV